MELFASREIAHPAGEVFSFVSDAANNPRWQQGMRRCEWTSPPPIAVGSIYEQEASLLGRRVVSRFEVTDYEADRSITITTIESSFPITVRRTVEVLGSDRCRVEARISGEPGRLFAIAGPLLRWWAQRSVDADYDRLVKLLES